MKLQNPKHYKKGKKKKVKRQNSKIKKMNLIRIRIDNCLDF